MARRYYFPSTGAAAVSPAFGSIWEVTTSSFRRKMVTTRISSSMTQFDGDPYGVTSYRDVLVVQGVSDPIGAQTITGTLKGQFRTIESSSTANAKSQIYIYVVDSLGTTVRGVLYAGDTTTLTSEWENSAATNRKIPRAATSPITLSSVTALNGDRIVIELGYGGSPSSAVRFAAMVLGDNSGTDLPEDETTVATNNPWIEFSQTITDATSSDPIAPDSNVTFTNTVSGNIGRGRKIIPTTISWTNTVSGGVTKAPKSAVPTSNITFMNTVKGTVVSSTWRVQVNGIDNNFGGGLQLVTEIKIDPSPRKWAPNTLYAQPQGSGIVNVTGYSLLDIPFDGSFFPRSGAGDNGFYSTIFDTTSARRFSGSIKINGKTNTTEPTFNSTTGVYDDNQILWSKQSFGGVLANYRGTWAPSTAYAVGDCVSKPGDVTALMRILSAGTSGSSQPSSWPVDYSDTIDEADSAFGGTSSWRFEGYYAGTWAANTTYQGCHIGPSSLTKLGRDFVRHSDGTLMSWSGVKGSLALSGSVEPSWSAAAASTYYVDGQNLWIRGRQLFGGNETTGVDAIQRERMVITGLNKTGVSNGHQIKITNAGADSLQDVVLAEKDASNRLTLIKSSLVGTDLETKGTDEQGVTPFSGNEQDIRIPQNGYVIVQYNSSTDTWDFVSSLLIYGQTLLIRWTNTVSGSINKGGATKAISPTTNVTFTNTITGDVVRPRRQVTGNVSFTNNVSGAVRKLAQIKPTTSITFTNTVSGSVPVLKAVRPTSNVTFTNTVSGSAHKLAAIRPTTNVTWINTVSGNTISLRVIRSTTNITWTNTVTGNVFKLRPVVPTTSVTFTNTVSGAIHKLAAIRPATNITFTNSVSGAVVRQAAIRPTTSITWTNQVSGNTTTLRGVKPTNITWTNNVSGTLGSKRQITPTTNVTFTNTLNSTISTRRAVLPATITLTNTVNGSVAKQFRVKPTTNITWTNTVSGSITTQPIKIVNPLTSVTFINTVSGSTRVLRTVKPTTNITWTNNVNGTTSRLRPITTSQITWTNTINGSTKALKAIKPTTNVTFIVNVNGGIVARHGIHPTTNVTYTNQFNGSVVVRHSIYATNVTWTNLVSGAVVSTQTTSNPKSLTPGRIVMPGRVKLDISRLDRIRTQLLPGNGQIGE